eukprot:966976-Pleurochrysis_carterae.AAC.2
MLQLTPNYDNHVSWRVCGRHLNEQVQHLLPPCAESTDVCVIVSNFSTRLQLICALLSNTEYHTAYRCRGLCTRGRLWRPDERSRRLSTTRTSHASCLVSFDLATG